MASATAHPGKTGGRDDAGRHVPDQRLPSLPMFETAQLDAMRDSAPSMARAQDQCNADIRGGWLRLDE